MKQKHWHWHGGRPDTVCKSFFVSGLKRASKNSTWPELEYDDKLSSSLIRSQGDACHTHTHTLWWRDVAQSPFTLFKLLLLLVFQAPSAALNKLLLLLLSVERRRTSSFYCYSIFPLFQSRPVSCYLLQNSAPPRAILLKETSTYI